MLLTCILFALQGFSATPSFIATTSFIAMSTAAMSTATMSTAAADINLADFSAENADRGWQIVNDTIMGGRSDSRFQVVDGVLKFSGTLNTNGGGFASVRSGTIAAAGTTQNAMRARVRGDGRPYQLRLYAEGSDVSYRAIFPTEAGRWQTIELPLAVFQASFRGRLLDRPPIDASAINGVGILLADRTDGPFQIEVAWLKLVSTAET
ncbi:MAG: CIA30 family protein [Pseudomonadota bacterium]